MSRWLIGTGLLLVLVGGLWPLIRRSGLGRLPGDIIIQRDGLVLYLPLTTALLISAVVSLILWLLDR